MRRFFVGLIRGYQKHLSPRSAPSCRFIPTCSNYAITAIERFGVVRGGLLALWRILRCNPWGKCGYDPVPESLNRGKSQKPEE